MIAKDSVQLFIEFLLKGVPCTMRNASMHHASGTMHQAPCTMHQAPCTMHQAPCKIIGPCNSQSILYRCMTILCVRFMVHGASFCNGLMKKYK